MGKGAVREGIFSRDLVGAGGTCAFATEAFDLALPSSPVANRALESFTFPVFLDLTHRVHGEADSDGCQGEGDGEHNDLFHVDVVFVFGFRGPRRFRGDGPVNAFKRPRREDMLGGISHPSWKAG